MNLKCQETLHIYSLSNYVQRTQMSMQITLNLIPTLGELNHLGEEIQCISTSRVSIELYYNSQKNLSLPLQLTSHQPRQITLS